MILELGTWVSTTRQTQGVDLDAVPIGSEGPIVSSGRATTDNGFVFGYYVNVEDKKLGKIIDYFYERHEIQKVER